MLKFPVFGPAQATVFTNRGKSWRGILMPNLALIKDGVGKAKISKLEILENRGFSSFSSA